MGAWGHGSFENDSALDFLASLTEENLGESIEEAFDALLELEDEPPEATESEWAIAAAELVAAVCEDAPDNVPEEVHSLLVGMPRPSKATLMKALRAIEMVLTDSELKDLFSESDGYSEWELHTAKLQRRLEQQLHA